MRKFLICLSILAPLAACSSEKVTIFFLPGCGYCKNAIAFFEKEVKGVKLVKIDISDEKNSKKFSDALAKCNLASRGVPLMIINGECKQGFGPETGEEIKQMLMKK